MSLEDVVAAAVNDAREDGLEGAQSGDEAGESDAVADVVDTETGDESAAGEGEGDKTGEEGEKADAEGEKTDEEKAADAAAVDEAKKVETKDEKKPDPAKKADLMAELGLKPRPDGRVHRIPLPRVETMVTKAREEAASTVKTVVETVGKALGVPEAELSTATFETIAPKLTEALADVAELRDRVGVMDELAPIMLTNGRAFVKMLAASNPEQYGEFLAVMEDGYQPPARRELPDEKDDPMPEPDLKIKLPDGTEGMTYSKAGQAKKDEWAERRYERKLAAAIDARFKPLDDKEKAAQSKEARQQQIITDLNDFMSGAEEWKGFKDAKEEIKAEMKNIDKKVPFRKAVRQAYETVVFGKLHTDRVKMRAEILAELKKAPNATGTKTGGKKVDIEAPVRGEGGDIVVGAEAAVRRSLAKARSAGLIK